MIPIRRTPSPCSVRTEPRLSPCRGSDPQRRRFGERYQGCQNRQSEESEAPQSKPESDYDLRIYEKDLDRCPSDELYRRHESCRQEERASHGKGDQEGASNWRRKAEICRGAIVRRRAELANCRFRVRVMDDLQLGEYTSALRDRLISPGEAQQRASLCEQVQVCYREQHKRLCDTHFPGSRRSSGTPEGPEDRRSVDEVIASVVRGGGKYQALMNGPEPRPLEGRAAIQGVEGELQRLLELLGQAA